MMDGLFSFLLFAGFFYFMMRFGCGSHVIHGGHHRQSESASQTIDPVCGKVLADDEGYGKMHAGKLYRFCSHDCLLTFEGEPERFVLNTVEARADNGGREK